MIIKYYNQRKNIIYHILIIGIILLTAITQVVSGQLKIYILAGQSNMQGHAHIRTLDHMGMDPNSASILDSFRNSDGTPTVCENVWISAIDTEKLEDEKYGKLTVGYGASGPSTKIGPEFAFGIYVQKYVNKPVLLIKTSWGGKSLHTDFRPPSAGPYKFNEKQLKKLRSQGKDIRQIQTDQRQKTGKYYHLMMKQIEKVLKNIKRIYPAYDIVSGYELSGFIWFQGWNDMVDQSTYPDRGKPGGYDEYTNALTHFIRDIRRDLQTPNLPFIIGVMGVGGPIAEYGPNQKRYADIHREFRQSMSAPALVPEFRGNVQAVLTEKYWDSQLAELSLRMNKVKENLRSLRKEKKLTPEEQEEILENYKANEFTPEEIHILETGVSNAAYHYLGSAKIVSQIGKAFADAIAALGNY